MIRFRMAVSVAGGVLSALVVAGAQTAPPASPGSPVAQTLELPAWLAAHPGARNEQIQAGADEVDSSYRVSQPPAEVISHYREQLRKSVIPFGTSFDGMGSVIRGSVEKASYIIQIREREEGTFVKVSYSPNAAPAQAAFLVPLTPANPAAPPISAPAPAPKRPDENPGLRQVEYDIDGSVHVVSITFRNAAGGSGQKLVSVPYHDSFFAPPGAFVYLSAQKTRAIRDNSDDLIPSVDILDDGQKGTVHVVIRVNSQVLQDATTSSPFGIATASGRVPN
jgi:hypothetical protein